MPSSRGRVGTSLHTPYPAPIRKRFGQHFIEPAWAAKVIHAMAPSKNEVFVEIGPGRSALTRSLATAAAHVIAVEIDRDLVAELLRSSSPNVTVISGDFLKLSPDFLESAIASIAGTDKRLRIVGNLPYNVASPILFRLIDLYAAGLPIVDATVMVQREVADRLIAPEGGRDYGVLTVLTRQWAAVRRFMTLPPGAFRPPPKVHSALVQLRFHPPSPAVNDLALFTAMTRAIFTRRRKTLANALAALEDLWPGARLDHKSILETLNRANIDSRRRPETLNIDELAQLSNTLSARFHLPN